MFDLTLDALLIELDKLGSPIDLQACLVESILVVEYHHCAHAG